MKSRLMVWKNRRNSVRLQQEVKMLWTHYFHNVHSQTTPSSYISGSSISIAYFINPHLASQCSNPHNQPKAKALWVLLQTDGIHSHGFFSCRDLELIPHLILHSWWREMRENRKLVYEHFHGCSSSCGDDRYCWNDIRMCEMDNKENKIMMSNVKSKRHHWNKHDNQHCCNHAFSQLNRSSHWPCLATIAEI